MYAHGLEELEYYNKRREEKQAEEQAKRQKKKLKQVQKKANPLLKFPMTDEKATIPRDSKHDDYDSAEVSSHADPISASAPANVQLQALQRYKVLLCRYYSGTGKCPKENCTYAHGEKELEYYNNKRDERSKIISEEHTNPNPTKKRESLVKTPTGDEQARISRDSKVNIDDNAEASVQLQALQRYKVRLCVHYSRTGRCPNEKCTYAHGEEELEYFIKKRENLRDNLSSKQPFKQESSLSSKQAAYKASSLSPEHPDPPLKPSRNEDTAKISRIFKQESESWEKSQIFDGQKKSNSTTQRENQASKRPVTSSYGARMEAAFLAAFQTTSHSSKMSQDSGRENESRKTTQEIFDLKKKLCPKEQAFMPCDRAENGDCPYTHHPAIIKVQTTSLSSKVNQDSGQKNESRLTTQEIFDVKKKLCPKEQAFMPCDRAKNGDCPYAHHPAITEVIQKNKIARVKKYIRAISVTEAHCYLCRMNVRLKNVNCHPYSKKHVKKNSDFMEATAAIKSLNAANAASMANAAKAANAANAGKTTKLKQSTDAVSPALPSLSSHADSSHAASSFTTGSTAPTAFPKETMSSQSNVDNCMANQSISCSFKNDPGALTDEGQRQRVMGSNQRYDEPYENRSSSRKSYVSRTRSRSRDSRTQSGFREVIGRKRSRSRSKSSRSRSRSRSTSSSSLSSRGSPSRTVLRKTGEGDWKMRDVDHEDDDEDCTPIIFEYLTEKEKVDLEKAHSLVEFAQSCLDSDGARKGLESSGKFNPFSKAYDESMKALNRLRKEIRAKQKKIPRKLVKEALESQANIAQRQPDSEEIDYLEVTTPDMTPLDLSKVEAYFSRFGSLMWCLQAGRLNTAIFKYHDKSLFKMTLEFNHLVEGKAIQLQGMKNGGVPVGKATGAVAATTVDAPSPVAASTGRDRHIPVTATEDFSMDTDYLASLTPEQFAAFVNSKR